VRLVPEAREAIEALESREPRRLARLDAPEERRKRQIQPLERHLPALGVDGRIHRIADPKLGQVATLPGKRHALAREPVGADSLFERGVVQPLMRAFEVEKRRLLASRRVEPIRDLAIDRTHARSILGSWHPLKN